MVRLRNPMVRMLIIMLILILIIATERWWLIAPGAVGLLVGVIWEERAKRQRR